MKQYVCRLHYTQGIINRKGTSTERQGDFVPF